MVELSRLQPVRPVFWVLHAPSRAEVHGGCRAERDRNYLFEASAEIVIGATAHRDFVLETTAPKFRVTE